MQSHAVQIINHFFVKKYDWIVCKLSELKKFYNLFLKKYAIISQARLHLYFLKKGKKWIMKNILK